MDAPYVDLAGVYAVGFSTVVSSHSQTWTTMSSHHKNRESKAETFKLRPSSFLFSYCCSYTNIHQFRLFMTLLIDTGNFCKSGQFRL